MIHARIHEMKSLLAGHGAILGALAQAWLLLTPTAGAAPAAERLAWQHANSPFRAEFEITSRPAVKEVGIAVQVPVCGLGFADGSDIWVFDEAGHQLPMVPLGESTQNSALVLVQPAADSRRLACYFGSKAKSPVYRSAFMPSLTVDIRTFPGGTFNNWKEVERLVKKSERIAKLPIDKIALSFNPANSAETFIMVFEGYLRVPKAGSRTFMLVTADAGYLFIDDKLVLSRDGVHKPHDAVRGQSRVAVDLQAGLREIRCVVVAGGSGQMAVLGRWNSDRDKAVHSADNFALPGTVKPLGVASRRGGTTCPLFRYRQNSYIGFQGIQFTEVECSTLNGELAEWRFEDGGRYQSASFRKVFVGLGDVEVKVRQEQVEASGRILFPQEPPPQKSIGNHNEFKDYSRMIGQENPEPMKLTTLKGYRTFLAFRDLNPDLIPICSAILKKEDADPPARREALRDLARSAAGPKPELAADAFRKLAEDNLPASFWPAFAEEYAEFALLRLTDARLADRAIAEVARRRGQDSPESLTLRLHSLLQRQDVEGAKVALQRLLDLANARDTARAAAVKRNALEQRFYDLLKHGFLIDAMAAVREWAYLWPEDWSAGRLSLARARWWRAAGAPQAALAELNAALALNPMLPNLPDVEFLQGELLFETGDRDKGRQTLKKVMDEYPNHPAAAKAREIVK
jgi:tetratricopeptide (TPR) repeat protein